MKNRKPRANVSRRLRKAAQGSAFVRISCTISPEADALVRRLAREQFDGNISRAIENGIAKLKGSAS